MKMVRVLFVALCGLAATACVNMTLPVPQPTMQTLQIMRGSDLAPMKVGKFTAAPGLKGGDSSVTIRSVVLAAPDGSLATYLQKQVEADLRAAGKLDPESSLELDGELTQSDANSMNAGNAVLAAKFVLHKADAAVFEKEISVDAQWDTSFVGAVAIPEAMNQYTALYDKLVAKLMSDPGFISAARR